MFIFSKWNVRIAWLALSIRLTILVFMYFDRIALLDLLEQCRQGNSGFSEGRLDEIFKNCGNNQNASRDRVLRCLVAKRSDPRIVPLIERCSENDDGAWEELLKELRGPMLSELKTCDLVVRAKSGERTAAFELIRTFETAISIFIARRSAFLNEADIEDLRQEAFKKAFVALKTFDLRRSTFEAFLRQQAKRVVIDLLRRRMRIVTKKGTLAKMKMKLEGWKVKLTGTPRGPRRIPEQLLDSLNVQQQEGGAPDIPQDSPSPSTLAALNEDYLELSAAIEKLESPCREIIELYFFDELLYREMATNLNIPIGTVKSRLSNCLKKLNGLFPKDFWNNRRDSSNEQ
jgi:RNA polymerase sigma-70 factor (ECF subfamily)